ncbi:MAG TPA: EI24 domain-containing protein, partial [Polyangia bacterium]|nr:EI24 domain-containing protein [Polyangia bacterium]
HGSLVGRLLWLLALLVVGAGAYIIYVVACLVTTAPFAGLLSERTEIAVAGAPLASHGFGRALGLSLRGAAHTLVGVALYVAIAAPLFVVHWLVPPLAPLCWIASALQTALFFAFDGFNEPLHRRGLGFAAKWRFVGAHLAESLGFGVIVAVLMAVPLVSVLVAPLAVVGGTLLHHDLQAPPTRA